MQMVKKIVVAQDLTKNKEVNQMIIQSLAYFLLFALPLTSESCSVVSDSLQPHGLYGPWNSLGQNTGVGSLSFLQGIFPTQGLNPGLPHCRQILNHWTTREASMGFLESPRFTLMFHKIRV